MTELLPLRIIIVGGGFTGIMGVVHAIRKSDRPLEITVVEPAPELGRGLAYGTPDPTHRINVPTERMGVFAADQGQVTRWFFERGILPDPSSEGEHGHYFVSRHAYGDFVRDLLEETLRAAAGRVAFRHAVDVVVGLDRAASGWTVRLRSGGSLRADRVALCFGHAIPALPCPVAPDASASARFVADPWDGDALAPLVIGGTTLIVGTGLTMADTVASLLQRGHTGSITAISRHGLLPRPHGRFINTLDVLDGRSPSRTALGLLRLVRRLVRQHAPNLGWQPPLDSVRVKLPDLWGALPTSEKQKVLRHLLPFWEVHRFRIAPQIATTLTEARARGQLTVLRAGVSAIALRNDRFVVTLRKRAGIAEEVTFQNVVLCTGPKKDLRTNTLVAALLEAEHAHLDDVGLGLAVDRKSRVLSRDGRPQQDLFAFGPLTRTTFGEMSGAPDISRHIETVAEGLFAALDDADVRA